LDSERKDPNQVVLHKGQNRGDRGDDHRSQLKVAIFPRRGSIPLMMAIGFLERMLSARLITLAVIDNRYDFSTNEGRYFGFGRCCRGFEMVKFGVDFTEGVLVVDGFGEVCLGVDGDGGLHWYCI